MASQLRTAGLVSTPERVTILSHESIGQQRLFTRHHLTLLALQTENRLNRRFDADHRHFYRYVKINTSLDQFTASFLRRIFFRYVLIDVDSLIESLLFTRRYISSHIISLADVSKHLLAIRHSNCEVENRC